MKDMLNRLYLQIQKNKYIEVFFICGVTLYAFSRIWQYSLLLEFSSKFTSLLRIITLILVLPKIVFQKYEKKEFCLVSLILYSLLCIALGGDKNLIIIPCILIGLKGIDIKKIIAIISVINISALIIHFISFAIVYYIDNKSLVSIFHFMWSNNNNNLMYRNRNMYAIRYLCALMQYIYITDRNNKRYLKSIIMLLISIFVYQISNSRVCFVISLYVLLFMVFERKEIFVKNIKLIEIGSLVFAILFTILMVCSGGNMNIAIFKKMDNIFAWRPHYLYQMCEYVGINLLPNLDKFYNIKEYFGNNVVIVPDNSYVAILLKWGVLLTIVLLSFIYYFLFKNKNDNITMYFASAMFLLFTMEYFSNEFIIYIVPLLVFSNYFNNSNKI